MFTHQRMAGTFVAISLSCSGGCASSNYTHYLVRPRLKKSETFRPGSEEKLSRPFSYGSTTTMKVRWNNGDVLTEVDIPVFKGGQRIVIEHEPVQGENRSIPAVRLVPPPPTAADDTLIQAYRQKGLPVVDEAPEVSLVRARTMMQQALRDGSYDLALQWCQLVVDRYPSHPEFLRAQASILLLLGEREKAIEIYEAVEEIESDPKVRKKLEELLLTQ